MSRQFSSATRLDTHSGSAWPGCFSLDFVLGFGASRARCSGPGLVRGFTLLEVLITLVLLTIIGSAGASLYAGLTNATHERCLHDACRGFFRMCGQRAELRGLPQRLLLSGQTLRVEDAPQLCLALPHLLEQSRHLLHGLQITASQAISMDGSPCSELPLHFLLPGEVPFTVLIHVAHP